MVTNMTITAFQAIILTALLVAWLCISIGFFVSMIQSIITDHRREKRDQEREARDLEYHQKRMKDYN